MKQLHLLVDGRTITTADLSSAIWRRYSILPARHVSSDVLPFGEEARLRSFTVAARELRLSATSVRRIIAELEADLDVRLINRTTRKMELTDAGEGFLQRSTGILEEIQMLRSEVRGELTRRCTQCCFNGARMRSYGRFCCSQRHRGGSACSLASRLSA